MSVIKREKFLNREKANFKGELVFLYYDKTGSDINKCQTVCLELNLFIERDSF